MPVPPFVHPAFSQTPDVPDLGCLRRRQHAFEVDGEFPFFSESAPFDDSGFLPHQAYFRVKCGRALFHQRVKVWMRLQFDGEIFSGVNPDWVLGGDFPATPSQWLKFPPRPGAMTYWFRGEHRDQRQAGSAFAADAAVGHAFDRYDHGTLSTVGWDDTGGDRDFDDMVVEVAVVRRRPWFDQFDPVAIDARGARAFAREVLPGYRAEDRPPFADRYAPAADG